MATASEPATKTSVRTQRPRGRQAQQDKAIFVSAHDEASTGYRRFADRDPCPYLPIFLAPALLPEKAHGHRVHDCGD
jgi:hypothetical protein